MITRSMLAQLLAANTEAGSKAASAGIEQQGALDRQRALKGYLKPDGSYQPGAEAASESAASSEHANRAQQFIDDNAAKGRKVSASFGGNGTVSLSQQEQNPYLQNSRMEAQQGQKLYSAAQNAVKPVEGRLQAMSMMHQLLDNPNNIDQKQLGALQARLTEGQGQRLLQSLVETLGAPKSVAGNSVDASNWLFGQAKAGLTAPQQNAMRENLFKHQAEVEQEYNNGKQGFLQSASLVAPNLGPDKQMQAISAAGLNSDSLLQNLHKRQEAYAKQGGGQVPSPQQPNQVAQPQTVMDKGMSGLASFFSKLNPLGGGSAPQAPQAAPQGNDPAYQRYLELQKKAGMGQ
jgi:hypothetical protein